jgi:hypothetical protein
MRPLSKDLEGKSVEDAALKALGHLKKVFSHLLSQRVNNFPGPGTAAWGVMNRRRAELIRKKNREGLSEEEWDEYCELQRMTHIALEDAFPRPEVNRDQLKKLEDSLRRTPESH